VVGGWTGYVPTDTVEFVLLDLENNPVPDRLKKLKKFPVKICMGGGALFYTSNNLQFNLQFGLVYQVHYRFCGT
jgi:hypothetical protein